MWSVSWPDLDFSFKISRCRTLLLASLALLGPCKVALGYSEALLRLRSLVFSLRRIVEYGYRNNWIQVQISGYDIISLLFLELFLLLILSELFLLWVLSKQ